MFPPKFTQSVHFTSWTIISLHPFCFKFNQYYERLTGLRYKAVIHEQHNYAQYNRNNRIFNSRRNTYNSSLNWWWYFAANTLMDCILSWSFSCIWRTKGFSKHWLTPVILILWPTKREIVIVCVLLPFHVILYFLPDHQLPKCCHSKFKFSIKWQC